MQPSSWDKARETIHKLNAIQEIEKLQATIDETRKYILQDQCEETLISKKAQEIEQAILDFDKRVDNTLDTIQRQTGYYEYTAKGMLRANADPKLPENQFPKFDVLQTLEELKDSSKGLVELTSNPEFKKALKSSRKKAQQDVLGKLDIIEAKLKKTQSWLTFFNRKGLRNIGKMIMGGNVRKRAVEGKTALQKIAEERKRVKKEQYKAEKSKTFKM